MRQLLKHTSILAVLVTIVLFTITACSGSGPTDNNGKKGPSFRYRIVAEGCPSNGAELPLGSQIPCEDVDVEQSVDGGPWETSFSYRDFRMHVKPPGSEEIRVSIGSIPGSAGRLLMVWGSGGKPLTVDETGTWTFRATADDLFGNPISPLVLRWEGVESSP